MGSSALNYIHCRSEYSLLKGVFSFERICMLAASSAEAFVGVTDVNNLYGLPDFIDTARRFGLSPMCGSVITESTRSENKKYLFTAYCVDRKGFKKLNTIISKLKKDSSPYELAESVYDPVEDLLEKGLEGLVIVSSRRDVLQKLREGGRSGLYAGFFYGEAFDGLKRTAARLGIKTAALRELIIENKNDLETLRLLRAVDYGVPAVKVDMGRDPCSARGAGGLPSGSDASMEDFFSAVPEALMGTFEIAEAAASAKLLPASWVFPEYRRMNSKQAEVELYRLCRAGVVRRYGKNSKHSAAEIERRLEYEMNIICRKGFASYFLVVADIVRQAPRTCGRGSAASSIVSYLLGITHVDPLAYNLFFERFLNEYRKDPPDIDVDFPWDERQKALQYVFDTYPGASAMVADHVCFKRRGAAREAAKALGMTDMQTNELMKKWRGGRGEQLPQEISRAAALLYGRPRFIGTHPGGVIITPGPITAYTHVQPSASGPPVIAWEKDGAEACGLVKIDLLGNRSLAVLRDTISLVNRERREKLDWKSFQPYRDVRTQRFIETGDTAGIFYIESPATRQLLKKMGRADFEHVVAASSIIRPAANKWINEYVRRLKGGGYTPLSPRLEGVLDETYGIMVYQEDVARVAMAAAGFNPGEADQLRKTLSKKNRAQKLVRWRERFLLGAASIGTPPADAEKLWDGILSFDGYSFCKSHSASYALVSYRLAWLKLRYPLEFMISVINNGGGFYSRQVYLNIVRRMGFPVLKPDINLSSAFYRIERPAEDSGYGIKALRAGFFQIRELPSSLIEEIIWQRTENGKFRNFDDFIYRLSPPYRNIRLLIKSGCLDSVAGKLNRPQMFWKYYHSQKARCSGVINLDGNFDIPDIPSLRSYSKSVCLSDEINILDLFFNGHPVDMFRSRADEILCEEGSPVKQIDSRYISREYGNEIAIAGTLAAEKEVLTSKKSPMSFVSFEDSWSIFETVFFPEAWDLFEHVLASGFVFLIFGRVESESGAEYLNVKKLVCLNRQRPAV